MNRFARWLAWQRILFNSGYGIIGAFGWAYLIAAKLHENIRDYLDVAVPIRWMIVGWIAVVWIVGKVYHAMGLYRAELGHTGRNLGIKQDA